MSLLSSAPAFCLWAKKSSHQKMHILSFQPTCSTDHVSIRSLERERSTTQPTTMQLEPRETHPVSERVMSRLLPHPSRQHVSPRSRNYPSSSWVCEKEQWNTQKPEKRNDIFIYIFVIFTIQWLLAGRKSRVRGGPPRGPTVTCMPQGQQNQEIWSPEVSGTHIWAHHPVSVNPEQWVLNPIEQHAPYGSFRSVGLM